MYHTDCTKIEYLNEVQRFKEYLVTLSIFHAHTPFVKLMLKELNEITNDLDHILLNLVLKIEHMDLQIHAVHLLKYKVEYLSRAAIHIVNDDKTNTNSIKKYSKDYYKSFI